MGRMHWRFWIDISGCTTRILSSLLELNFTQAHIERNIEAHWRQSSKHPMLWQRMRDATALALNATATMRESGQEGHINRPVVKFLGPGSMSLRLISTDIWHIYTVPPACRRMMHHCCGILCVGHHSRNQFYPNKEIYCGCDCTVYAMCNWCHSNASTVMWLQIGGAVVKGLVSL